MKKLLTFLMLSVLAIGVGWAETTVTLTQSNLGITGSSYSSGEKTLDGITYSYTDLMKNNTDIQAKASTGEIHNSTAFSGNIASVAITHSGTARATTISGSSDGSNWTQVATGSGSITGNFSGKGYKYFKITRGTNAAYWTKIEITYDDGTVEPDPETPTATVSFNPAGGEVDYETTVTLSLNGEADGIKYTIDGNNPTSSSATYSSPISITEDVTIKAAAFNSGNGIYELGEVATATYTIKAVEPTVYSRVTSISATDVGKQFLLVCEEKKVGMGGIGTIGTYGASVALDNNIANGVATITYQQVVPVTLGGSADAWTFETPDGKFLSWTSGNTLDKVDVDDEEGNVEWKIEFADNNAFIKNKIDNSRIIKYNSGNPRFACYTSDQNDIQLYRLVESGIVVTAPTISGTDNFEGSTQITITAQDGASIYYTTDESTPTTVSTQYTAPFTITETTTVKAIAVVGETSSSVATATFTAKPLITSVAQFNALENNTNFKYIGDNLVAIKQNGNQLYVQDGENGMLIYGSTGQTYTFGQKIPKNFTGTRSVHEGAPEMTNPAGFTASTQNVDVTPVEITPNEVNLANFGRYTIIKNASFNTSAKTITSGGETIAYYTTFMSGTPDNDVAYDIIGVCGYYNNNPQFLPISYTKVETTGPDYYLVGSFNKDENDNWIQQDDAYKLALLADGSYVLNKKTIPDGVEFKIIKFEEGEEPVWYGGTVEGDGAYYGIDGGVHINIPLDATGKNFRMAAGGICTFTVSTDLKLTVNKETQLFFAGTPNNWGKADALEATSNGWTIEKELAVNDEFKFIDEWGAWYGGGNTIAEANLGEQITLNSGNNFVMAVGGNFVINVAADKSSFVITRKSETSTAMFDFDNDYATLFPSITGPSTSSSHAGDITEDVTATVNGVSLTVSANPNVNPQGTNNNRIWNSTPRLRLYGGIVTITAPEGYNLTGITFTNNSNFNLTPNAGSISGDNNAHSWVGVTETLVLTVGGNTQIDNMNVTITKINENTPATPVIEGESPFVGSTQVTITCTTEGATIYYTTNGSDPTTASTRYDAPFTISDAVTVKARAYSAGGVASQIATKVFEKTPSLDNLTAFYNYTGTDEFAFTGNLVAIAQSGKYLYAQDDAKGVLVYGEIEPTYYKNDKIPAGFHAKKGAYAGAPQMTNPTGMETATEQTTIQPVELTIAKASQEDQEYLYRYAVIKEIVYQDGSLVDGDKSLTIYNERFTTSVTPIDGKTYNVTGIVGWHNGPQFMPLEYELVQLPVNLEGVAFTAERQWATWFGEEALALPENVTAYVVTGINDAGTAVEVESVNYIPANTGVLLYSTTATESVSAMPAEAGESVTSLLQGGPATVNNAYVLYNNQFILAQDGTTVGAHRCYLPASASTQGAPRLLIGDPGTVTGIEDLRYDSNGKPVGYYDLTGRYVGTSLNGKRGIFITSDGKKVVR